MWHEKERLQEGHRKEARQSGIKQHSLLFTCQRHVDTKTKPKQVASLGLHPGRHCLLAHATCESIAVTRAHRSCHLQLFLLVGIHKLSRLVQGLHVKGSPWETHIKVLEGQYFKSGSLLAHKPFLLHFLSFTSYKILGTSFQFFHLSPSSKPWLIALAYQTS